MTTDILLREKKLLFVFALLILLTLLIGLVGIFQIQGLNQRIEDLGRHHLKVGQAVLGMRVRNTYYAMEIRSYIFWRIARYQNSLQMTEYVGRIAKAEENFRDQLETYRRAAREGLQKDWDDQLTAALEELIRLGKRIVALADKDAPQNISSVTQDQLMIFEKRVYDLDQFLNDPMGRANLEAIQEQINLAKADKEHAILFLGISLAIALGLGTVIVFLVYRQRIQDRANRKEMLNRMMDVEETERKKLSAAVHDEMGQDLSALMIRLGLLMQQGGGDGGKQDAGSKNAPQKVPGTFWVSRRDDGSESARTPEHQSTGRSGDQEAGSEDGNSNAMTNDKYSPPKKLADPPRLVAENDKTEEGSGKREAGGGNEEGTVPGLKDEAISEHIRECRKIASALIKKSHNIAFLLRPPDLDDLGLAESLEALLLETKHMTGMDYDYQQPDDFPQLSPEYSLLFYRISQELLTNMAKHAKAAHVSLRFKKKHSTLQLSYADDGQGFDYEEVLKNPGRRREDKLRLGLLGLKERVELLDGTMRIDSRSGRGTRVTVELPI